MPSQGPADDAGVGDGVGDGVGASVIGMSVGGSVIGAVVGAGVSASLFAQVTGHAFCTQPWSHIARFAVQDVSVPDMQSS